MACRAASVRDARAGFTSCGRRRGHGARAGGDDARRDAGFLHLLLGDDGIQPAQQGRRARGPGLPVAEPVTVGPPGQVRVPGVQHPVMAHAAPDRTPRSRAQPGPAAVGIWVLPARVAEVCSEGFSPACLTTARAEANRVSSPVWPDDRGADRRQPVDAGDQLRQPQLFEHGGHPVLCIGPPGQQRPPVTHQQVHAFERAARCAITPPGSVSASHSPFTILW